MKFNFKIQDYQTEAVNSIVNVFRGQPFQDKFSYIRDIGKDTLENLENIGYKNADIILNSEMLLNNIHDIQHHNNIKISEKLIKDIGKCSLDVEMETGTGKTYVYIKTMFELNAKYGWSKFIVVVPSIAIREGVRKSFEMMESHFMEHYHKKAHYFIYDSSNLTLIDDFSKDDSLHVMIINAQAFNKLANKGKDKSSLKIYSEQDTFQSRRPIDVIKANKPILILDEPQKLGKDGSKTQEALKKFNALFSINYSATHAKLHNLVYVLDSLDAYTKKLVKRIKVKSIEVKNLRGNNSYLYLAEIVVSPNKPPQAKLEFEVKQQTGIIKRKTRIINVEDNLYSLSNELNQYKDGYVIAEINPTENMLRFNNGIKIYTKQTLGDVDVANSIRIQIRETIASHFAKEKTLFKRGIKTLSLFFIDEVAKYRMYDDETGEALSGDYAKIFEEEYLNIFNEYLNLDENDAYQKYLKEICSNPAKVHNGYFSIDKKKHFTEVKKNELVKGSDDVSAYDLILKDKERLLSFKEPTRFIFSHSALREGWDNPNIFQICALKHSDNNVSRRQEVGRGLRLCVDKKGNRIDYETFGDKVQDINLLTVISSGSYSDFVKGLQAELRENLYDRPTKADKQYFINKSVNGTIINEKQATMIYQYLTRNEYIDADEKITEKYRNDQANKCLKPLPTEIAHLADGIEKLINSIFDEKILDDMVEDGNKTTVKDNVLNDNFYKEEFQTLWNSINQKCSYSVNFNSEELIAKAVESIDKELTVTKLQYVLSEGTQNQEIQKEDILNQTSFTTSHTTRKTIESYAKSHVKYDLIGKIAQASTLTRKTTATILKKIQPSKFAMFKANPEEFISEVIRLIKEQKASVIINHISYNPYKGEDNCYESSIFTEGNHSDFTKVLEFKHTKHIQPYIFTDGIAENSIEKRFAHDLEKSAEVSVYAKLPKEFKIHTPVGDYTPDWAIAFYEGKVKHIYFVVETKGSTSNMQLKPIEQIKIKCAKKLFDTLNNGKVHYGVATSYKNLLDIINA